MNIVELKEKNISELTQMAKQYKIEGAAGMRKQELMFALLQHQIEKKRFYFRRRDFRDFTGWIWIFKIAGFKLFTGAG